MPEDKDKKKNFTWGEPGSEAPPLPPHSAQKLEIIKDYLQRYFDTVVPNPHMEKLKISLVDGFCGGGAFSTSKHEVSGTPVLMLKAVEEAEKSLNENRIKRFNIDARYYFVDKEKSAIEYLRGELRKHGYEPQIGETIHIFENKFEEVYQGIIERIVRHSPYSGRSLFLLDQCGYTDVSLGLCRDILNQLEKSEIILTFAVDWLIDYMSNGKGIASLEITEEQIGKYLKIKGETGYRLLIQHFLIEHIKKKTGAPYFTPFFLRSREASRDLWLVHLSKHPTARNVMVSSHWGVQNSSVHYGRLGLNMLGFDPGKEKDLFEFYFNAETQTAEALENDIPGRLESLIGRNSITFADLLRNIANETPARLDQIEATMKELHKEGEIKLLTKTGREKKLRTKSIEPTTLIRLPPQRLFSFFKKPKK